MQLHCDCENTQFEVIMDYGKNELILLCSKCGERYHASMLITISKMKGE